jgi:peptide/nickel transport system permease protein
MTDVTGTITASLVFLYTDILVWGLVVACGLTVGLSVRRAYWRNAYKQIGASGTALFCLGLLICFVTIGLLDSIHFQAKEGAPIVSVLDKICQPLKDRHETRYSAPLAATAFVKSTKIIDGKVQRINKRLDFGGTHLESLEDHTGDVVKRVVIWTLVGISLGAGMGVGLILLYQRISQAQLARSRQLGTLLFFGFVGIALCLMFGLSSKYHLLGTNKVGTSTLLVCLKSVRTALVIGTLTTLIMTPLSVLMGVVAGYRRGWVDDVVQYLYTTVSSIPNILLISAAMLIVQTKLLDSEVPQEAADLRLLFLCLVLGLTSWAGLCRLVRAEVLKLREIEYVQAARAMGLSGASIIFRHLVPNVMHIVLIDVVLSFSGLVLAEAVLAYLGIGVHPSTESFGNMIIQAQEELASSPVIWWNLIAAFGFMLAIVVPANLFGDAVRDALDPRLRVQR